MIACFSVWKQQVGSLTLIPSAGGAFEVSVNGVTVFSKLETGNFPDADSIVKGVRSSR